MDKAVYLQVADFVAAHPNGVGRLDVAQQFGIHKSGAVTHLEKCVERGMLIKVYTWARKNSRGWVYYAKPESVS
jgi:predicted ArsR family transcriptional regulator